MKPSESPTHNRFVRLYKRAAFTLVETLLALALSSTLILAVFSLIDTTLKYHVTGSDQVLVSQRLLGLLQDLRLDIHAVQPDPHWQHAPELQATSDTSIDTTIDDRLEAAKARLTSQLQLPDAEKYAEPIRLAGQSDWLVLTLGHANPRWPQDASHEHKIVWSLGGRGSITVPTHNDHGRWTTQIIPGTSQAGLLRSRIVGSNKQPNAVQSDLVIPAQELSFRFMSGGRWHASWNSSTEKRLPDAIEVSLQLSHDAVRRTWIIYTSPIVEQVGAAK